MFVMPRTEQPMYESANSCRTDAQSALIPNARGVMGTFPDTRLNSIRMA